MIRRWSRRESVLMKSGRNPLAILTIALLYGCGGGSGGSGTSSPLAMNVLAITVNGSLCSGNPYFNYLNKPCVEVTICSPDDSACQTIDDIVLDTGSYGLRVFRQALGVSLPKVNGGSGDLAECLQFADGSSEWGPVQMASVILGKEPAVQVPIHVIDSTFGTPPPACQYAETS